MEFSYWTTVDSHQWNEWAGLNVEVRDGALAIASEPRIEYTELGFDAIDIYVDRDENVYAIRPSGDLYKHDAGSQRGRTIRTNRDADSIADPCAICVVGDHVYVAARESGAIAIVSERSQRTVGRIDAGLADPVAFERTDRAIYVLDRDPADGRGRVLRLRGHGSLEPVLSGLESPTDFGIDGTGTAYVLEERAEGPVIGVHAIAFPGSRPSPGQSRVLSEFDLGGGEERVTPTCIEALMDGVLVVNGRLATTGEPVTVHYREEEDGGGSFDRRVGSDLRCTKLHAPPSESSSEPLRYYAIGGENDRVYVVDETNDHRRHPEADRFSGQAFRRIDAGSLETRWHRVKMEFRSRSSNTRVEASYYATDDRTRPEDDVERIDGVDADALADLRDAGIDSVWDLLARDPAEIASVVESSSIDRVRGWLERAVDVIDDDKAANWKRISTADPHDVLLDEAEGRYLHVGLELVGDVDTSPMIESFRVYYPRRTYLRYLPEVFQDDRRSVGFLERFLSVFESAYVDVEEGIETISRYFDPEGVPNEYLPWLAGWLAIDYGDAWPEEARRELLVHAPTLFKQRGTKRGLRGLIELFLAHVEPPNTDWMVQWERARVEKRVADGRITEAEADGVLEAIDERAGGESDGHLLFFIEHPDLDSIDGDDAKRPFETYMRGPRSFAVFVGPFVDPQHKAAVDRIVNAEQPAYTHGTVVELRHHCKLAGNSFLGINSTLTPRRFVLDRSTLGGDTVLEASDEFL